MDPPSRSQIVVVDDLLEFVIDDDPLGKQHRLLIRLDLQVCTLPCEIEVRCTKPSDRHDDLLIVSHLNSFD